MGLVNSRPAPALSMIHEEQINSAITGREGTVASGAKAKRANDDESASWVNVWSARGVAPSTVRG